MYEIVATEAFKNSLSRFTSFITNKYGEELALEKRSLLKQKINSELPNNPHIAPISDRLLELAIVDYRQWKFDDHNLLFYKTCDMSKQVTLLAVMDARQSIRKLLFEIQILL